MAVTLGVELRHGTLVKTHMATIEVFCPNQDSVALRVCEDGADIEEASTVFVNATTWAALKTAGDAELKAAHE